jgi:hypothetical protein
MPWIGERRLCSGRNSRFLAAAKLDQEGFLHRLCRNAGSGSSGATQGSAVRGAYFLPALGKVTIRSNSHAKTQLEFGLRMTSTLLNLTRRKLQTGMAFCKSSHLGRAHQLHGPNGSGELAQILFLSRVDISYPGHKVEILCAL